MAPRKFKLPNTASKLKLQIFLTSLSKFLSCVDSVLSIICNRMQYLININYVEFCSKLDSYSFHSVFNLVFTCREPHYVSGINFFKQNVLNWSEPTDMTTTFRERSKMLPPRCTYTKRFFILGPSSWLQNDLKRIKVAMGLNTGFINIYFLENCTWNRRRM